MIQMEAKKALRSDDMQPLLNHIDAKTVGAPEYTTNRKFDTAETTTMRTRTTLARRTARGRTFHKDTPATKLRAADNTESDALTISALFQPGKRGSCWATCVTERAA